jgi:hemerythrin-like domain-containing protein
MSGRSAPTAGTDQVVSADFAFAHYEHGQLKAELEYVHEAADTVGRLSPEEAASAVARIRLWLAACVGPHTAWEDLVLYPQIDRVLATTQATRLMRCEHLQIHGIEPVLDADIELLRTGSVTHDKVADIRAHLLDLESLVRVHVETEEQFLRTEINNPVMR